MLAVVGAARKKRTGWRVIYAQDREDIGANQRCGRSPQNICPGMDRTTTSTMPISLLVTVLAGPFIAGAMGTAPASSFVALPGMSVLTPRERVRREVVEPTFEFEFVSVLVVVGIARVVWVVVLVVRAEMVEVWNLEEKWRTRS